MEQKVNAMNKYFDEQIALCGQRGRELDADERKDEAVFEKVKANIYDVFRKILAAAVQVGRGNEEATGRFFAERAEQIPAGWAAAYEKAKEHNDAARMQTEQVKLDAVRVIKTRFSEIWEGRK